MAAVLVQRQVPYRRIQSNSILQIGQHVLFLNETATTIWDLVDGKTEDTDLVTKLARQYPTVPFDQLAADAAGIIRRLIRARALTYSDGHTDHIALSTFDKGSDSETGVTKNDSPFSICLTPKRDIANATTVRDRIESAYWQNHFIQKMHLELTYRCNYRCVHCYNTTHSGKERELSTEQWMDVLHQLKEMNCHTVTLTGGELFIRRDAMDIIEEASRLGFSILMNTNGSLVTDEVVDRLTSIKDSIQMLEVSFYGADQITHDSLSRSFGGFTKSTRLLTLFTERGIPAMAKFITLKDNFAGIPIFEKTMRSLGAKYLISSGNLIPRTDRDQGPLVQLLTDEQYNKMLDTRPEDACPPGSLHMKDCQPGHVRGAITPDGSVSPCEWLTDFKLGNLKDAPLREIWYSQSFSTFRKVFEEDSDCPECSLNTSCQRCPAMSYLETGNLQACAPVPRHYAELHQNWTETKETTVC
jgi:MoaA/NifB/PqqE/SkfB family radical SAM enzyme